MAYHDVWGGKEPASIQSDRILSKGGISRIEELIQREEGMKKQYLKLIDYVDEARQISKGFRLKGYTARETEIIIFVDDVIKGKNSLIRRAHELIEMLNVPL